MSNVINFPNKREREMPKTSYSTERMEAFEKALTNVGWDVNIFDETSPSNCGIINFKQNTIRINFSNVEDTASVLSHIFALITTHKNKSLQYVISLDNETTHIRMMRG